MKPIPQTFRTLWCQGIVGALLVFALAFCLRMMEWPSWQDSEFRLGEEWLLATHDAYHWVAGAEGFGLGKDHPMAVLLRTISRILNTPPASIAFWFPAILSSCLAVLVFIWVWALGSLESGVCAGILASFSPGFLARTLLGFYDTDLITLFIPLAITLAPATWTIRHMLLPQTVVKKLFRITHTLPATPLGPQGNPISSVWLLFLALSGLCAHATQSWHSVFPYIIRYTDLLLFCMTLCMAPRMRRPLVLLGALSYVLPSLLGTIGLLLPLLLLGIRAKTGHSLKKILTHPLVLLCLWLFVGFLLLQGDIAQHIHNHIQAYLKTAGDIKQQDAGPPLVYPSVAQSIVEVQDVGVWALLSYFHPWPEAAFLGLVGFFVVVAKRPGALFLLPLAALAILSTKLGGRMVMFGAPIISIGLSLPLYWLLARCTDAKAHRTMGALTSVLLIAILIVPFVDIIPTMSQGPMINRRHADCLAHARSMTPENALLWLWWDWGYAAHHFAKRQTIADGAMHGGPSLYLPAAVFATDNPRFARQLMRYTESVGNCAGKVFEGKDGAAAQALMDTLRSPETPLIQSKGRLFILVSFEMLRLGFWISHFGSWNFITERGEGGALSIIPNALFYRLDTGEVRLNENAPSIDAASISVFDETGITHRDYLTEWMASHPKASAEEKAAFLAQRRNVHFLFNKVTDEKIAIDERLAKSLMVRLMTAKSQDPALSPYFKLVYDNVFARIYEVL
ncbi:MAG: hypothetical protein IJS54_07025 [Desulfovibrio sp.]|nr:hypothetical protein [Desulfovibrio sp.]